MRGVVQNGGSYNTPSRVNWSKAIKQGIDLVKYADKVNKIRKTTNTGRKPQNPFNGASNVPKGRPPRRRNGKFRGTVRSAGFFKQPRKSNKAGDIARNGVWSVFEQGGVNTDPLVQFVGHATATTQALTVCFSRALVKMMAIRMKKPIESMDSQVQDFTAGDAWTISWRSVGDDTTNTAVSTVYAVVGAYTWNNVASGINTFLEARASAQVELISIAWVPLLPALAIRVGIRDATVSFVCKSSLKLQNRSTPDAPGAEDQADEVDNVPLYGKSYTGRGSGTAKLTDQSIYLADIGLYAFATGIILRGSSATVPGQVVQEPPLGHELAQVSKTGKCHLDPGQLKTSKLVWTATFNLNNFMRKALAGPVGAITKFQSGLGKFTLFCFEKMLETNNTAPVNISIGWEVNKRMGCVVHVKNSTVTTQTVTRF